MLTWLTATNLQSTAQSPLHVKAIELDSKTHASMREMHFRTNGERPMLQTEAEAAPEDGCQSQAKGKTCEIRDLIPSSNLA